MPTIWCLERAVSRWNQRRDGDVRSWLFAILHNLAVDQFRKTAARGRHVRIDETSEDQLSDATAQEHRLMYQDVLNRLARLPEEQRSVLLLVAVEDLSYADAAKVLNNPRHLGRDSARPVTACIQTLAARASSNVVIITVSRPDSQ